MRTLVALLLLLLMAGCRSTAAPEKPAQTPAAAALAPCDPIWTPGAEITAEAATTPCRTSFDERFVPTAMACDPSKHHGVPMRLVLGPDGDYAVFVNGETTSEVDDGTGTGEYRDTLNVVDQELGCKAP